MKIGPWTDKQRARRLAGALKKARVALMPMTKGTYWITGADVSQAHATIDKIDAVMAACYPPPVKGGEK